MKLTSQNPPLSHFKDGWCVTPEWTHVWCDIQAKPISAGKLYSWLMEVAAEHAVPPPFEADYYGQRVLLHPDWTLDARSRIAGDWRVMIRTSKGWRPLEWDASKCAMVPAHQVWAHAVDLGSGDSKTAVIVQDGGQPPPWLKTKFEFGEDAVAAIKAGGWDEGSGDFGPVVTGQAPGDEVKIYPDAEAASPVLHGMPVILSPWVKDVVLAVNVAEPPAPGRAIKLVLGS